MKYKNWSLFLWALNHWTVNKKCLRNKILLGLMNLSGVTPTDMANMMREINDELLRRGEL